MFRTTFHPGAGICTRPGRGSMSAATQALGPAGGERPGGRLQRKAKLPGLYEVEDVTPPRRSLGIHSLPPNTHNGDQIEVDGGSYVVQSVVMQYKLVGGRYLQEHKRLEVNQTGRFLYNKFLEEVYTLDVS